MIADLKPYPAMRDSGVPWLREVPEHWETRPLKRWVRMNVEVLPETTAPDHEFRYLDIGSVGTGILTQNPQRVRFGAAPSRARRVIHRGDTIVSTVRTYLKAIYFVDGEAEELVCSTGFAVLTPRVGTLPEFVSYLAQSNPFTDRVTADSVGIAYPAIAETRLGSFHVAVPRLSEQAAIVRFLDHADRRIRRYIRAKQTLIRLLEEQKQAIIHCAVTRGLDPNVRLKPSGVEWLGDVPEHWQLLPLKRACSLLRDGTHLPPPRQADGFPLLSVRNIVSDYFVRRPDDSRISETDFNDLCRSFTLRRDDVLLAIVGATLGKVALVPEMEPFQIQRSLAVLRPRARLLDFRFLAAFLRGPGFQRALWTTVAFSAQPGIYLNTLSNFNVVVPPIPEQQSIVAKLDGSTACLMRAISSAQRELSLLREYRTRLIADVVTGKLDVREAAAQLPDEAEEPEPLDVAEALPDNEEDAAENLDAVPEEAEA